MNLYSFLLLVAILFSCNSNSSVSGNEERIDSLRHRNIDTNIVVKDRNIYLKIGINENNRENISFFFNINDSVSMNEIYSKEDFNKVMGDTIPTSMLSQINFYNLWFEGIHKDTVDFSVALNKPDTDYGVFVIMSILHGNRLVLKSIEFE